MQKNDIIKGFKILTGSAFFFIILSNSPAQALSLEYLHLTGTIISSSGSEINYFDTGDSFVGFISFIYDPQSPEYPYGDGTQAGPKYVFDMGFGLMFEENNYFHRPISSMIPYTSYQNTNDYDYIGWLVDTPTGVDTTGVDSPYPMFIDDLYLHIHAPDGNALIGSDLPFTINSGAFTDGYLSITYDANHSGLNEEIKGVFTIDSTLSTPAPVPEPTTMLLFGTGLVGLVGFRIRKKKQ